MLLQYYTLLLLTTYKYLGVQSYTPDRRIVKGYKAERHQFPYLVSIEYKDEHICGGGILSPTWVISAAHCFRRPDMKKFSIAAGLLLLGEDHDDVQRGYIKNIVIHPRYPSPEHFVQKYDLALLNLQTSFVYTVAVSQMVLPDPSQSLSGMYELAGWGYVKTNPKIRTSHLQYLRVRTLGMEECMRSYNLTLKQNKLYDSFCAVPSVLGPSGCMGDSGSPLVQNRVVVGVISWGSGSCNTHMKHGLPNVYIRVSSYLGFIRQHVRDLQQFVTTSC